MTCATTTTFSTVPLADKPHLPPPTEWLSGAGAVGSPRTMRPPSPGKTPPKAPRRLQMDGQMERQKEPPQLACTSGPWAAGGVPRRGCRPPHALCCPSGFSCASAVPSPPRGVEWGRVTVQKHHEQHNPLWLTYCFVLGDEVHLEQIVVKGETWALG